MLKSDNGPPFTSLEFKKFAEYLGFQHRRVTPCWPKANGEAERFMRTLGKAIRTATVEGEIGNKICTDFFGNIELHPTSPQAFHHVKPSTRENSRRPYVNQVTQVLWMTIYEARWKEEMLNRS